METDEVRRIDSKVIAFGLVAVAVQSLWEPVLRMPANGVLIAVAAAILLHRPPGRRRD